MEDEQWLGGLLHANDELVMALMTFEQLDRSIDADSDSEVCMKIDKVETGGCNRIGVADKVFVTKGSASRPGVKQRFTSGVPFPFFLFDRLTMH